VKGARPKVFVAVPNSLPYDAVGNDVLGMAECLRRAGYETGVFAQWIHPARADCARVLNLSDAAWQEPGNVLVYHHAMYWELGEELLEKTAAKVVVRHHNVTPPRFYEPYHQKAVWQCARGIEATDRLARRPGTWYWGASSFNTGDLAGRGAPRARCRVLPPCHRIEEELAAVPADNCVFGRYREGRTVLFVGGLRPHKGHLRALEVFARFRRLSERNARLAFVGGSDPDLRQYESDIRSRAGALGLEGELDLVPAVTPSQLRAFYLAAGAFLCVSEHEGFCVPLVESMYFRLPIVAWGTTAVKETCGDAGIVLEEYDPDKLAEALEERFENPELARELARRGRARYQAFFSRQAIERRLLDLLREVEQEP
jgi:glycosyltransferase involved in cell wall biosynthesis